MEFKFKTKMGTVSSKLDTSDIEATVLAIGTLMADFINESAELVKNGISIEVDLNDKD